MTDPSAEQATTRAVIPPSSLSLKNHLAQQTMRHAPLLARTSHLFPPSANFSDSPSSITQVKTLLRSPEFGTKPNLHKKLANTALQSGRS